MDTKKELKENPESDTEFTYDEVSSEDEFTHKFYLPGEERPKSLFNSLCPFPDSSPDPSSSGSTTDSDDTDSSTYSDSSSNTDSSGSDSSSGSSSGSTSSSSSSSSKTSIPSIAPVDEYIMKRVHMSKMHFRARIHHANYMETRFFLNELKSYAGQPMRPYKLPKNSRDKAYLDPLPFERDDPATFRYKPITVYARDETGKKMDMHYVNGYRELLHKRGVIQSKREQEEIEEEFPLESEARMRRQKENGWFFGKSPLDIGTEHDIWILPEEGTVPGCYYLPQGGKKPPSKRGRRGSTRSRRRSSSRRGSTRSRRRKSSIRRGSSKGKRKGAASKASIASRKSTAKGGRGSIPRKPPVPSHIVPKKKARIPKEFVKTAIAKYRNSDTPAPSTAAGKKRLSKTPSAKTGGKKGILKENPPSPQPGTSKGTGPPPAKAGTSKRRPSRPTSKSPDPRTVKFSEEVESENEERREIKKKHTPILTQEEKEAVRVHELHLERDAEWLELSPSDKEDEDALRSENFGKEKLRWMHPDLSYESQLFSREFKSFTRWYNFVGRQGFTNKPDYETGLIHYLVNRRKQIPFTVTSLFLWIATVFIIQGYIDISTKSDVVSLENIDSLYLVKVEKIELEKYKILLFSFMANLFLSSLWSITVLLKDGLFICQYLNSLVASLTQMEISGAVGLRRLGFYNNLYVVFYASVLSTCFYFDWPRTVRGSSGIISMLLCRSFIPEIRIRKENEFFYFQLCGLILNIYVVFCTRGTLTLIHILASNLKQVAEKWNFKFGAKFGQFGIRSRGQMIRLRLNQSLIKIFLHHRFIVGLTSLFGRVFATPIAAYFVLHLSVFAYYLIYFYRYKPQTPEDHKINGGARYFHAASNTTIDNYHTKAEDILTTFWVVAQTMIDFVVTTEAVAAAGTAVMAGFEFVRRLGQILSENSHERRLMQSLQWSFSATSPCIVNVNKYFPVNRPSMIGGLGTALVMFSLIIQLNQDKTVLTIDKQPCSYNASQQCYITRRVLAAVAARTEPPPSTTTEPTLNLQVDPYENLYWFWYDCDHRIINVSKGMEDTSPIFNFSTNLPLCHRKFHKDQIESLNKTYPPHFARQAEFDIIRDNWKARMNGSISVKDPTLTKCMPVVKEFNREEWIRQMQNNHHVCYSKYLGRYLILQDVYICPGCPPVGLRGLRNHGDCGINPYPISPFYSNNSVPTTATTPTTTTGPTTTGPPANESALAAYLLDPENNLKDSTTQPSNTKYVFKEIPTTNYDGLRKLGYFECTGREVNTDPLKDEGLRDDCGWIPLKRYGWESPILEVVVNGEKLKQIPDAFEFADVNITKRCYNHNIKDCQYELLSVLCPWRNFKEQFDTFTKGFLYGSDCYNTSLFFNFVEPDELIDTDEHGRFHAKEERKIATDIWDHDTCDWF